MVEVIEAPGPFKRGNETSLIYDLKMAAWEWLYHEAGCRVIGLEVKLEGPGGRIVDLAAVGPQNTFYIVEVKSSRSDFSRDDHTAGDFSELQGRDRTIAGRTNWPRGLCVRRLSTPRRPIPRLGGRSRRSSRPWPTTAEWLERKMPTAIEF